jgi:hypothetical protein
MESVGDEARGWPAVIGLLLGTYGRADLRHARRQARRQVAFTTGLGRAGTCKSASQQVVN